MTIIYQEPFQSVLATFGATVLVAGALLVAWCLIGGLCRLWRDGA